MTDREAFKAGFLMRIADEGGTPEDAADRAEAAVRRIKQAFSLMDTASSTTLGLGLGGLGLAGGVGYLGGQAIASSQADPNAVEEQRKAELVNLYKTLALRAKRKRPMPA